MNQKDPNAKEGMRIRMVSMIDDPNPIQNGEEGTIRLVDGMGVIHVNWDNGRTLGVVPFVKNEKNEWVTLDEYILEPALENVFDNLNYDLNETKKSIKIKPVEKKESEIQFGKKFENKPKGVVKEKESVKKKNIKTEEGVGAVMGGGAMGGTNTVSAWGGQGAGITPPITGSGKPTWGEGPLVKKKKKKIVKEVTMTHYKVGGNIVRKSHEDTRHEAWASDKNGDGWKLNDDSFYKNGEIVEPLAKISTTWDDGNLDVSKEWDKSQNNKLKKEDLIHLIKTRINESKKGIKVDLEKGDDILTGKFKNHKDKVKKIGKDDKNQPTVNDKPMLKFRIPKLTPKKAKAKEKIKEEEIDEETSFGSVWGVNGPPVGPAFAAKKGEWKMVKRPIWKGGTIIQKDDNEGILNPISEVNTVKSKGNEYVTIANKKCNKLPCSQGAIDKPLKISKTVKGSGTYIEEVKLTTETIKNIHEVSLETGKTFDEVYKLIKNNVQI